MSIFDNFEHEYVDTPLLDIVELRPVKLTVPETSEKVLYILPKDADALGLSQLVSYADGQPADIRLPLIPLYILPVLKVYRDELRVTKERVRALESQVGTLQVLVDAAHDKIDKLVGSGSWS